MKRPKGFHEEPAPEGEEEQAIDAEMLSTEDDTQPLTPLVEQSPQRATRESVKDARLQVRQATKQRRRREREERRRFTHHSRARRRRVIVALSAVSILALFVGVGLFTPVMSVRNIDVEGASRIQSDDIVDALQTLEGEPLALVSDEQVFAVLAPFSLIESYAVEKIPPSTLRLVIRERQPILAVIVGERFTLLDASGVTIETVDAEALPETIPVFRDAPTEPSEPRYEAVSAALRNMPDELKAQMKEISAATPQQITLVLRNGVRVVWGDARDTGRKAMVFAAMVAALGERSVSVIDVSAPGAPVYVP